MNRDIAEGNWKQFKGRVKEKWGELSNDDVDQINGRRDNFVGKLQEKYGMKKDEAESEWDCITAEDSETPH